MLGFGVIVQGVRKIFDRIRKPNNHFGKLESIAENDDVDPKV
jgi:hypothetical protein